LALALSKLGRFQEAFEAFKNGKDEATAYNNIGYLYLTAGKYDEAIKSFEKAIEINPRFYVKAHENMKEAKAAADIKSQGKNIEPEDIPKQVPQSETVKKDVPEPEWKEPFQKSCPNCHIVEAGETLSSIAKKYNMTVENLKKLNGISSEKILRVGTKLRLF
jgi:tetratricopeptide (TPR) repeat protein